MFASNTQRKEFEHWAVRHGFSTDYVQRPETSYYNPITYAAAVGWLGAKKAAAAAKHSTQFEGASIAVYPDVLSVYA